MTQKPVNERIIYLMESLGENKNSFAVKLGVSATSIGHIKDNRNYPGYELLAAILEKFPEVNSEWLLIGSGQMFKENKTYVLGDNNYDNLLVKYESLERELTTKDDLISNLKERIEEYKDKFIQMNKVIDTLKKDNS